MCDHMVHTVVKQFTAFYGEQLLVNPGTKVKASLLSKDWQS